MSTPIALPIVAERWPLGLEPDSCKFGRSFNNTRQQSPRNRIESTIVRGRPLWKCTISFKRNSRTDAKLVDFWLEGLFGGLGSVMLWDFKRPFPTNIGLAKAAETGGITIDPISPIRWAAGASLFKWVDGGGVVYYWDSGLGTKGQKTVLLKFPASAVGQAILQRGDRIQLKRRLYVIADDVDITLGDTEVNLTTPILDSLTALDEVRIVRASAEFQLATQDLQQARSYNQGFETISVDFTETSRDYAPGGMSFAP
jgi:hypothetical protein